MGFAEEMLNLGEKLKTSCENRLHAAAANKRDTRKMINKFHQDNRHMAHELRNNLNEFRENLESNTDKALRHFRNEHREMSRKQGKALSEFTGELTHNVKGHLRKCHKNRMDMRDMFDQAHNNFFRCMREIGRMQKHPSHRFEHEEPRRTPGKTSRKKKRTRH